MTNRVHGNKKLRRRQGIQKKDRYQDYMPELKEDFQEVCGYCGKSVKVTKNQFEPYHFVPKIKAPERECDYYNLVYSC